MFHDVPVAAWWVAFSALSALTLLWFRARRRVRDRERRERGLAEQLDITRERLQLALDALGAGTWHWDLHTEKVVWDARNAQLFGIDLASFRGSREHAAEGVMLEDVQAAEREAARAVAEPGTMLDCLLRLRDGERVLRLHGKVVRDDDGKATGIAGLCHDVTRAQKAQLALAESEERLRATFEQAAVGIAHLSPDGKWLRVNQKVCEIMGFEAEELMQTSFQKLTHPDDLELDLGFVGELIAGERDRYQMEKRYIHKGGYIVWGSLSVSLVRAIDGTPKYFISVIEDISERKLLEAELREAKSELEQRVLERTAELSRSNDDLAQFAYVASHDLQEPLRMVTSYLELLERRYTERFEGEAREFMDYAVDGARRMKLLIDDLLEYSRLGTRPEPHGDVDLNDALDEACANLAIGMRESGARLEVGDLPTVTGQRSRLVSLLQNILDNSIKYRSDEPPHLRVSAEPDEKGWRVHIQDNGIGVEEGHTTRIFEVFQRLHRDAEINGTGIGLASAKKIVEAHGGRIWMSSEPGAGSTVSFTLMSNAGKPSHEQHTDPSLVG
ncbi:MAG: hypothetical protein DHS20C15_09110 [Planctomycetota bacterium]|nr:MAG: hypothetical protein DHS20C15_09110 [Planctomycetota bacterium]